MNDTRAASARAFCKVTFRIISCRPLPSRIAAGVAVRVAPTASARMVMSTASVSEASPAVTVSVNIRVASDDRFGATNDADAVVAPVRLTVGEPPVCAHA